MTYSASDTGPAYCVGMLSAKVEAICWILARGKKRAKPVLSSDHKKGIYGPGHNSFTKGKNGEDIMVFHAGTEEEIVGNPLYNPNRHCFLMRVDWDADNRPVFSYDQMDVIG